MTKHEAMTKDAVIQDLPFVATSTMTTAILQEQKDG
jgi:hypothetical protein